MTVSTSDHGPAPLPDYPTGRSMLAGKTVIVGVIQKAKSHPR